MHPLKVWFDAPTHGWLPVRLLLDTTELAFVASHIPSDPIEALLGALLDACDDRAATVWWPLEPGGYELRFSPVDGQIQLRVLVAQARGRDAREVASLRGSKDQILLPFWRALRRLQASGPTPPHWPELSERAVLSLGERLRTSQVFDGG